jgi:hypothetical protein
LGWEVVPEVKVISKTSPARGAGPEYRVLARRSAHRAIPLVLVGVVDQHQRRGEVSELAGLDREREAFPVGQQCPRPQPGEQRSQLRRRQPVVEQARLDAGPAAGQPGERYLGPVPREYGEPVASAQPDVAKAAGDAAGLLGKVGVAPASVAEHQRCLVGDRLGVLEHDVVRPGHCAPPSGGM